MALTFSGTDDRVVVADAVSIRDLTDFTVVTWLYNTSTVNVSDQIQRIVHKGLNASGYRILSMVYTASVASFSTSVKRATTDTVSLAPLANFSVYGTNKWLFCAGNITTAGSATDQKLWMGDLTTVIAEPSSYTTQTAGSGTVGSNSGVELCIGNRPTSYAQSFDGRIAFVGIWNRVLAVGEIQAQQFRPHVTSGCVLFAHFGFNGTGTQADLTGNGNGGTVTGATVADHVPVGPLFGYDRQVWTTGYTPPAGGTVGAGLLYSQKLHRLRLVG